VTSPPGSRLAVRIVRANLLVAVVTALSLAAVATTAAHWIWLARESRRVAESARLIAAAVRDEARDEHHALARAAADVFEESAVPEYRFEAWQGENLVARNRFGVVVGPPGARASEGEWIVSSQPIDAELTVLVAAPPEGGTRALRLFGLSLAAALPLCLLVAAMTGRRVSAHITQPLEDLRRRVLAATPGGGFPATTHADPPTEVRDIDLAFHELWSRLGSALTREREFAGNASHELRTPLTRLRLNIEQEIAARGESRELGTAREEIDRLVRLIDSLLVLARDASAATAGETVNLADVVRQAARRVVPSSLPALATPDEALVRGDEGLLAIAVENLLENARKFSTPGASVPIHVAPSPERICLEVASPGARIAEAERERVFERFYRSAEARQRADGHGLGLSLCRHIARLHGGEALCVSRSDEDARFRIDLPVWRPVSER
jgi:signal transduction histidine kinase